MSPEAKRILEVFRLRDLSAGAHIHPADFGDAIIWDAGFVRDAPIREALSHLFKEGYLIELSAAFELTQKGATYLLNETEPKYGARIYKMGSTLLIKQTVLRGVPAEYVIDEHRERHVRQDDDAAVAAAVRDAVMGRL